MNFRPAATPHVILHWSIVVQRETLGGNEKRKDSQQEKMRRIKRKKSKKTLDNRTKQSETFISAVRSYVMFERIESKETRTDGSNSVKHAYHAV